MAFVWVLWLLQALLGLWVLRVLWVVLVLWVLWVLRFPPTIQRRAAILSFKYEWVNGLCVLVCGCPGTDQWPIHVYAGTGNNSYCHVVLCRTSQKTHKAPQCSVMVGHDLLSHTEVFYSVWIWRCRARLRYSATVSVGPLICESRSAKTRVPPTIKVLSHYRWPFVPVLQFSLNRNLDFNGFVFILQSEIFQPQVKTNRINKNPECCRKGRLISN